MDQVHQIVDPAASTSLAEQSSPQSRSAAPAAESRAAVPVAQSTTGAPAASDSASLRGISLIDASAMLSSGRSLVTDLVLGADNQVAQIRVVDAVTHKVIASCPPDTIARAQREMLAYQQLAAAHQAES